MIYASGQLSADSPIFIKIREDIENIIKSRLLLIKVVDEILIYIGKIVYFCEE